MISEIKTLITKFCEHHKKLMNSFFLIPRESQARTGKNLKPKISAADKINYWLPKSTFLGKINNWLLRTMFLEKKNISTSIYGIKAWATDNNIDEKDLIVNRKANRDYRNHIRTIPLKLVCVSTSSKRFKNVLNSKYLKVKTYKISQNQNVFLSIHNAF